MTPEDNHFSTFAWKVTIVFLICSEKAYDHETQGNSECFSENTGALIEIKWLLYSRKRKGITGRFCLYLDITFLPLVVSRNRCYLTSATLLCKCHLHLLEA